MILPESRQSAGMSLLELLLAVSMLSVFTGVVAAVMEVTLQFVGEVECPVDVDGVRRCNETTTDIVANGVLIDRHNIETLFDEIEHVLVQPGVSLAQINKLSAALNKKPRDVCFPNVQIWRDIFSGLNFPDSNLPRGYHVCLWRTSLPESEIQSLLDPSNKSATPGIYVLQALPTQLNPSNLPVRRLICRPRPFC